MIAAKFSLLLIVVGYPSEKHND